MLSKDKYCRRITGTRAFIAPEVYNKDYGQKCDVWSIGIIAYILLSGQMPFGDRKTTNDEMEKLICKGEFNFNDKVWTSISTQAKEFISSLLIVDQNKRPSAKEAIQLPWIQEMSKIKVNESVASTVLTNL